MRLLPTLLAVVLLPPSLALQWSSLQHPRRCMRVWRGTTMCARPGQTDLMDGEDESRNAQVAALKRLFYSAEAEESVPDEESAAPSAVDDTVAAQQIGLLPELPCCRWPWEILPHHQKVLVVFEPHASLSWGPLTGP